MPVTSNFFIEFGKNKSTCFIHHYTSKMKKGFADTLTTVAMKRGSEIFTDLTSL
jgi:hypothetical protein